MKMKNKILPEGTQLITRNLAIAAGLVERFGKDSVKPWNSSHMYWEDTFNVVADMDLRDGKIIGGHIVDCWRITVTTDNQALLSGVVMHNDYIIINGNYVLWDNYAQRNFSLHMSYEISKRHYPHANATLPAITANDFDEVILPENKK